MTFLFLPRPSVSMRSFKKTLLVKYFCLFLAQKHQEPLLFWSLLKTLLCSTCPSQSLLCAIVSDSVASLSHLTVLYGAGARSNIRKAPSQPLWLTSCSRFHSMKTESWTASGMLTRILLPVLAMSLRAWRIWRWSRQIQAAVEKDVKKQTAAGEEKKWTWTFLTSNKSPVLGPLSAPPAQVKAWTTSCSAAWI